jgi:hypothetical protein
VGFINQILEGSLLSQERLMEAREQYSPVSRPLSPAEAFDRWTQRIGDVPKAVERSWMTAPDL